MSPFDIFMWHPPQYPEPHPAVIVSHPARVRNKDWVEVLVCTTQRAGRPPELHEVLLDQADGLDWPTLCRCDLIYAVPKTDLRTRKGQVTEARRGPMVRAIIAAHDWAAVVTRP